MSKRHALFPDFDTLEVLNIYLCTYQHITTFQAGVLGVPG